MSLRITLQDIAYQQGGVSILEEIQYTFTTGLTYVIGHNGAGKSSLLKLLTTAVPPSRGEISYSQLVQDSRQGAHRKLLSIEEVRRVTGYLPQEFTGYPEMTVEKFLMHTAVHKGIPRRLIQARVKEMLVGARLTEQRKQKLGKLSGGERQKVGLVQAMIHYPRLCILDEPFEGLDLEESLFFRHQLHKLSYHAVVLMSTHQIELIDSFGPDEVVVMEAGRLRTGGLLQQIGDLQRFFVV